MILVVFGFDQHPFDEALDVIEPLRTANDLVIQHGHTRTRDWPDVRWFDFVPFETLTAFMREADAIVCHAGVGTIMTVLALGRRPVVISRRAVRGEHVDDHQLQIVDKLAPRGHVVSVQSAADIVAAIEESRSCSVTWHRDSNLAKAVVAAVDGNE